MVLVFAFHRSKNCKNVSPFNEIFLKKISLRDRVLVITIRNISLKRPIIYIEDFESYRVIELSAFLLPGSVTNSFLRFINFVSAKTIHFILQKKKLFSEVTVVHQIGLLTPIGYYFSKFCKANFILQIIGNDTPNFGSWKINFKSSTIITANSKALCEEIPPFYQKKVIYRGVDVSLHGNFVSPDVFTYNNIFYGGGFPDYREKKVKRFNYKGGLSLLDVAANLHNFRITIAGPNCEVGEDYAKKLNLKEITFLHYLEHSKLLDQIRNTDIVIIPSFGEGIANIAMEAMLAEKLVISRRVGGMPELIRNDYNGILFDEDYQLEDILKKIAEASDNTSLQIFDQIRKNAKTSVLQDFDNDKMIDQYSELYNASNRSFFKTNTKFSNP